MWIEIMQMFNKSKVNDIHENEPMQKLGTLPSESFPKLWIPIPVNTEI